MHSNIQKTFDEHKTRETIKVSVTCIQCKETYFIHLTKEEMKALKDNKTLIQHSLKRLSADERELLQSGFCPTCFDNIFKENEDE